MTNTALDKATIGDRERPTAFVPEAARLPVLPDMTSELVSWIGEKVSVYTSGYRGSHQVDGKLLAVLKAHNGDPVLKVESKDSWHKDGNYSDKIPSIHLVPFNKVIEVSRAK